MPAIIDKIAKALHLNKDANKEAPVGGAKKDTPAAGVEKPAASTETTDTAKDTTPAVLTKRRFDSSKITVIFVLGGPGAGKGTQCAKLVDEFGFSHLSAGDLLRAEQTREGSEYGELIRTCIREGSIVPMEVTVKLLENAMAAAVQEKSNNGGGGGWQDGRGRFLVDGFPRKMDQAEKFEETVCTCALVLFFTTTEEVMLARLLERGKTSGREDDNAESIKKRFNTYKETTMPVIEYYTKIGKVAEVDSTTPVDTVYEKASAVIRTTLAGGPIPLSPAAAAAATAPVPNAAPVPAVAAV